MTSLISYSFFKSLLARTQKRNFEEFLDLSKHPRDTQLTVLKHILQTNQSSEFGQEHCFSNIQTVEEFRQAVPVNDFESLRPYVDRQRDLGSTALTSRQPIHYNRTSGTTGDPKDVPVVQENLDSIKRDSQLSAFVLTSQSNILRGKIFAIGGPATEETTTRGIGIGAASGLLYRQQSRFVRSRYVLPPEAFEVCDSILRYKVFAVCGLAEKDVSAIATANPSTFVRLLTIVNENLEEILRHVSDGTLPTNSQELTPARRNPSNAQRLLKIFEREGALTLSDIWPNLRGVVTWTGGSCGFALSCLLESVPSECSVFEFGYNASELRGTINVDLKRNLCLPTLHHTFFEFVQRDDWENGRARFVGLEQLVDSELYYVFATTTSGLYRYDMNDIMRVSDRVHKTPALEFVQKGKGVTNITGEKVSEFQVLEAIEELRKTTGLQPEFFVVLADEQNAHYLLCTELAKSTNSQEIAKLFDEILQRLNVEYASKRNSGRLGKVRFVVLPRGTGFDYRTKLVATGQRDVQFKYLHLQYLRNTVLDLPPL